MLGVGLGLGVGIPPLSGHDEIINQANSNVGSPIPEAPPIPPKRFDCVDSGSTIVEIGTIFVKKVGPNCSITSKSGSVIVSEFVGNCTKITALGKVAMKEVGENIEIEAGDDVCIKESNPKFVKVIQPHTAFTFMKYDVYRGGIILPEKKSLLMRDVIEAKDDDL